MSIDINSPEFKAALEEATAPLIAKRDELLRELKQARKGQQIQPEDVEKLESQLEAMKGELAAAQKQAKVANTEAEKAKKALESTEARLSKTVKESGLIDALTKAGVTNPVHLKAAKALLAEQVQVAAEGDTYALKVGDKGLADFAAEWAKGDEGKFFVAAAQNGGGGSTGGGGAGSSPKTLADAKTDDDKLAVIRQRLEKATSAA